MHPPPNARHCQPLADYRREWSLGTQMRVGVDGALMVLGRPEASDINRASLGVDIHRQDILPFGIVLQSSAKGYGDIYDVSEVVAQDRNPSRIGGRAALDATLPLNKTTDNGTHIIAPRVQLIWSDEEIEGNIPNVDTIYTDFDYVSLFSNDRFVGYDLNETGLRANIGARYAYVSDTGWRLGSGVGRIFRFSDEQQFDGIAGLEGDRSNFVGFAELGYDDRFLLNMRGAFDEDLAFSRSEVGISYLTDDLDVEIDWVRLGPNATNGTSEPRQDMLVQGRYKFHPNWQTTASLRRDLADELSIEQIFGITYGNECVELSFEVERDFSRQENVPVETSYAIAFNFIGLGGTSTREWGLRKCTASLSPL